jgi:hypothetical protein
MKFFLLNTTNLQLIPLSLKYKFGILLSLFVFGLLSFTSGIVYLKTNPKVFDWESDVVVIDASQIEFTQNNLINKLKQWNIKFPHIVLAQSMLETNNYKSSIFKENHNLFGMKEAKRRVTISQGTNRNHAYYNNWVESLLDYGFYQSHYLSNIKTEEQYYSYLEQYYAEDDEYVIKIKKLVEDNNLKAEIK